MHLFHRIIGAHHDVESRPYQYRHSTKRFVSDNLGGHPGSPTLGQVPAITCVDPDVTAVHKPDHAPRSTRTVPCPIIAACSAKDKGWKRGPSWRPLSCNIARQQTCRRASQHVTMLSVHPLCVQTLPVPTSYTNASRTSSINDDIDHERVVFVRASCHGSKTIDQ